MSRMLKITGGLGLDWFILLLWITRWRRHYADEQYVVDLGGEG